MGKDTKRKKKDSDFAVTAFRVVQEAIKEPEPEPVKPEAPEGKNPHAVALGHLGGLKGGKAHKSLANPYPRTPAMAAGIADHVWTIERIVKLAD